MRLWTDRVPKMVELMIAAEIKVRQRRALRQNFCKPLCILSFHFTARQFECDDAAPGCHCHELPENEVVFAIAGVGPEAPAQADNGRQAHLVLYLFDSLRGPSQHDRPASRPSPAPVLSGDGFQSCSKGVSGEQQWLRLRSLTRGARPLLLLIIFLASLGSYANLLRLFAKAFWS